MNRFHGLAIARTQLPRLTIAQRVIDKIVANALHYQTETGESLVGFVIKSPGRSEPDLYVLETIAPDDSAERHDVLFVQGDDLQGDIFTWWSDNWDEFRERRRGTYSTSNGAKWDVPLAHLGDWHKHPGTLVEPSWGDSDTAREYIHDKVAGAPQILAILATVWDRSDADNDKAVDPTDLAGVNQDVDNQPQPLKIPIDSKTTIRIDCWYMSRHTRRFVRLKPMVVADNTLPVLPIVAWHMRHPERMSEEYSALSKAGYAVSIDQYNADKVPPLEICLTLAKRSSQNVLIAVTQADYPASMPTLRMTPMSAMKDIPEGANLFRSLWDQSQPLPGEAYPTWEWNATHTLLDLVHAVEERLTTGSVSK